MQLMWHWLGITDDVRWTVESCEVCQRAKHGRTREDGSQQRLYVDRPWQRIAVDFVGPYSRDCKGQLIDPYSDIPFH